MSHTVQGYKVAYMLNLGLNGLLQLGTCLGKLPVEILHLHPGKSLSFDGLPVSFILVDHRHIEAHICLACPNQASIWRSLSLVLLPAETKGTRGCARSSAIKSHLTSQGEGPWP